MTRSIIEGFPSSLVRMHSVAARRSAACSVAYSRSSAGTRARASTNSFGSSLPEVVSQAGWDGAWQQRVTPWDAGKPAPLVKHLLSSGSLPSGDVLVPGCGSGYDAFEFAKAGRSVVGLDLSVTAQQQCRRLAETSPELAPLLDNKLTLKCHDFFTYTHRPFGVIWDYTFMSALPPDMWPAWADNVKRLLHPTG